MPRPKPDPSVFRTRLLQQLENLAAQGQREMMMRHKTWLIDCDKARQAQMPEPKQPQYLPSRLTRRAMDVVLERLGVNTLAEARALK